MKRAQRTGAEAGASDGPYEIRSMRSATHEARVSLSPHSFAVTRVT